MKKKVMREDESDARITDSKIRKISGNFIINLSRAKSNHIEQCNLSLQRIDIQERFPGRVFWV